jgi:hypothetical protein
LASRRERYERANMRGGMGVRKRLSEESLRDTYRLNGVPTGSALVRCHDKYGRWELGFTLGVIVRRSAQVVQIRWADDLDKIAQYSQGDARYEVDRGRWRILGLITGNPLDPSDPIAVALTELRGSYSMLASANADTPPDRGDEEMAQQMSNAASERAAAKKAVANGDLKERDTYTAKQVATRCGTDAKTMRKFFRSKHSTVEPVGQGGRYEFDARDFPTIKKEFDAWTARSQANSTRPTPKPAPPQKMPRAEIEEAAQAVVDQDEDDDFTMEQVADAIERAQEQELGDEGDDEPTEEELAELSNLDLDLDDLDAEEVN